MDYPLSFGVSSQGGFGGNPMPDMTSLDSTPTLGVFSGSNGMDPQTMMMIAQMLGKIGAPSQQPISLPQMQHTAPQAMIGPGVQMAPSGQALGHAMLTGGR